MSRSTSLAALLALATTCASTTAVAQQHGAKDASESSRGCRVREEREVERSSARARRVREGRDVDPGKHTVTLVRDGESTQVTLGVSPAREVIATIGEPKEPKKAKEEAKPPPAPLSAHHRARRSERFVGNVELCE